MPRTALLAATILTLAAAHTLHAATTDILIGLDSKVIYNENGQTNIQPGHDALLVMDVSNPAHPRIRASLELANSLLGPPTNLQITPDGKLALLANSVNNVQDGGAWKTAPDDKLFVVDLAATPPKLVDTLTVGKQPSGLAIARNGTLALIANRAGKSVSVVAIENSHARTVGEVPLGQEAAAVAITPDGKRAFAVMNLANKVAVLSIDGTTVTYDKAMDIPAPTNPYDIDITPDGRYAIASATGAGTNNADTLTVIDTSGPHPHVVNVASPGIGPEGFAIAPGGKLALAPLLLGTGAKPSDWFFTKGGQAALLALDGKGGITVLDRKPLGALPEGVAFSPDGTYAYIGNFTSKTLQVFHIAGGKLVQVGAPMPLPGQPASLRGPAR